MRNFMKYFVLATVGAAAVFLACSAIAQYSAPKSDLPGEYQEPAPLPPGSITLEELDRRRGGAPTTGTTPTPAPAPAPAAPPPTYGTPAPAPAAPPPTYGTPAPAPEPAITYGAPGAAPAPAAPPPAYGAPAPAPSYGAPQISTLPMVTGTQAQPPAPYSGAPAAPYGAPPAGPSGARSDLPGDYGAPSEPLPPGSITLEAYDAKVKGGAAAAPAAAPAGAPAPAAPPPTLEETTEEITGDAFGADEDEASAEAPSRWDNY
jgi:hypothetical protein